MAGVQENSRVPKTKYHNKKTEVDGIIFDSIKEARRYEQLTWAEADGHAAQRLADLAGWLCGYDLVVNTVPSRVLTEPLLADLKSSCLVIDVASKPGGVDMEAAGRLGVPVIWALSLPGKVAPVTAARAIRQTIYHILEELEV